jgi:hypothetical protein
MESRGCCTEGKSPFIYVHTQFLLKCDEKRWTKLEKKKKQKITYPRRYIATSTDEATRERFCIVPSTDEAHEETSNGIT